MLRRDNVPSLLNKPGGFSRGYPNGYPFAKYPGVSKYPQGIWAFPDPENGYTRRGYTRRVPRYLLSGVQLYCLCYSDRKLLRLLQIM